MAQSSSAHTLQKRRKARHHAYREFPQRLHRVCPDVGINLEPVLPLLPSLGHWAEWVPPRSPHLVSSLLTESYLFLVPRCTDEESEKTSCTPNTDRKCVPKDSRPNLGLIIGLSVAGLLIIFAVVVIWTRAWKRALQFTKRFCPGECWLRVGSLGHQI